MRIFCTPNKFCHKVLINIMEIWVHKTILPCHCAKLGKWAVMYMCASGILILLVSIIFLIRFWNCWKCGVFFSFSSYSTRKFKFTYYLYFAFTLINQNNIFNMLKLWWNKVNLFKYFTALSKIQFFEIKWIHDRNKKA